MGKAIKVNRLCILLLTLNFACGYIFSGKYTDDPDNWERVYNQPKPENIEIIHSQFTRYPHFTYEFDFFIQTKPNPEIIRGFIKNRSLKKVDFSDRLNSIDDKPNWFVPKSPSNYEIYVSKDPFDNFELYIDNQTGDLFWSESQY